MCPPYFYIASPLLVDHGAAATAVQKKACRAAAAYAAFAATAATATAAASAAAAAAAAAAVLLLCCCCCHIRVPLLRVPKKICCASRCQPIFPFFDTRFVHPPMLFQSRISPRQGRHRQTRRWLCTDLVEFFFSRRPIARLLQSRVIKVFAEKLVLGEASCRLFPT